MLRLSWFTILVIVCSGCSFHIDSYKRLRNVDVTILGEVDHEKVEKSAKSFEDPINKQFDSNVKLPRLPFKLGTYIDSVTTGDGIMIVSVEGEF